MKYIENPFKEGQSVVCINENFPVQATTEEDKSIIGTMPITHPKKGEEIEIDEILGEFIRFTKYDTKESFNWWKHTHFKKKDELTEEEQTEYIVQNNLKLFKKMLSNATI